MLTQKLDRIPACKHQVWAVQNAGGNRRLWFETMARTYYILTSNRVPQGLKSSTFVRIISIIVCDSAKPG